jgi:replication factor A1
MTKEDLKSHIDDIINALSDDKKEDVSRKEIEAELEKFIEYGVPIEQAKQTILKKFGEAIVFTGSSIKSAERTLISDLKPNQSSVKILGHIIAINPKEITVKGETRKIFYGILGDETGTIPFTSWSELGVEKGDVIEISNAYTREWQGAIQLNLGDRVNVEKTEKERLPKSAFEPRKVKVIQLHSGMGRVDVTARVLNVSYRETDVNGETKKVFSGIIGDETGKAQFTAWDDFKIKDGDVLRINGGYVKSWKGIPQLTFDSNVTVTKLEKDKISNSDISANKMPIHVLLEKRGALDVEVIGTIIDIRTGSGYIMRCPECNRVLKDGICNIHDKVTGIPDLRLKLVIDDGTGAVGCIINKELSEKILNLNLNDTKKMNKEKLYDELNSRLFTKKICLKGNALADDFGTNIIANDVEFIDINIQKEAEKLASDMEGLL